MLKRVSSRSLKDKKKRWKEYSLSGLLFFILLSRVIKLHLDRRHLVSTLVAKYEEGTRKDGKLTQGEVVKFLADNGVVLTQEQFAQWAGDIDATGDGFDNGELIQASQIFEDFHGTKNNLRNISDEPWIMIFTDGALVLAVCSGLVWALSGFEAMERKVAANSFVSAVRMSRTQKKWQSLEAQLKKLQEERTKLHRKGSTLTTASREASERASEYEERIAREMDQNARSEEFLAKAEAERERLKREANEARSLCEQHEKELHAFVEKEKQVEIELARLRSETEKHMREAHMSTSKLQAMNKCLRGINAIGAQSPFKGASEGKYATKGATPGFSIQETAGQNNAFGMGTRTGFRMESFVFGYPTENNVELYEVNRQRDKIGEGADGCFKCRNIASGEELALKIYDLAHLAQRRQIMCDLNAHQAIRDHEHIVKYKAVVETQEQIFVLMELIHGKDLFTDIVDRFGFTERRAVRVMHQLCSAISFLHGNDIIHGDIKPENVMLEKPETDEPLVKLIDFGFSCFLNVEATDFAGTLATFYNPVADLYAPPEALAGTGEIVTRRVDMFRLGCTLYVMLMATYPFNRNCRDIDARTNGKVIEYDKWKTVSDDAKDLIVKLTKDRMPVEEVLRHPWMVAGISS